MGSIVREADLGVSAEAAWEVLDRYTRSELHVFSSCYAEHAVGDCRVVTNAQDGTLIHERNVTIDPARMRAVYTVVDYPGAEHHQAEMRVVPGSPARLVWTTDLLPDALAEQMAPYYDLMFEELRAVVDAYDPATRVVPLPQPGPG
jgi:hypothetical protein